MTLLLVLVVVIAGLPAPVLADDAGSAEDDALPLLAEWVWEKVDVPRPSKRSSHAMAFDRNRGVTVLFGGQDSCVAKGDTWEWDGMKWEQRNIGGNGPSPRFGHSMTYDFDLDMVVLFGGASACVGAVTYFNDLWGWDGTQWHDLSQTNDTINGRAGAVMEYDTNDYQTVLYGGSAGTALFKDTWLWRNSWQLVQLPAGTSPPNVLSDPAGAYLHNQGLVVVGNKDAYLFDGTEWQRDQSGTTPPVTTYAAMVAIPEVRYGNNSQDTFGLLFGGWTGDNDETYSDESWILWLEGSPLGKWISHKMEGTPPPRYGHKMAYDYDRQEVLLFGGRTTRTDATDEFWILHRPGDRYVSVGGTDAGNCRVLSSPCKTIRYALRHSPPGGTIKLQAGDYDTIHEAATGQTQTVLIEKEITISGSYDGSFGINTEPSLRSRIIGSEAGLVDTGPRAITVQSGSSLELDNVDVWWGSHKTGGSIYNAGTLHFQNGKITYGSATQAGGCVYATSGSVTQLQNSSVTDCNVFGSGAGGAVYSAGDLAITAGYIGRNRTDGDGGGVYHFSGLLDMTQSTLSGNQAKRGGGLYMDAVDDSAQFQLENVDIVYNQAEQGGGVYLANGKAGLRSVSVLRNVATASGGGIYRAGGTFDMSHSILALNQTNSTSLDCTAIIVSNGYNIVGNTGGACSLEPSATATGDRVGTVQSPVDPNLDANGVPLPGGPAYDGGGPSGGCPTKDRLGVDRSLYAPCDIGAYESTHRSGDTKPQLPAGVRYVSINGSDDNNCLSPAKACASVGRALVDLPYNGTVAVTGGTFTQNSYEGGWYVDQSARVSCGWNESFTEQTARTVVDGASTYPCVGVSEFGAATLDNLTVQNCKGYYGGGVNNMGTLTLMKSLVINNQALRGGGIFSTGETQLLSTLVANNQATEVGGGVYQLDGIVQLDHITLAGNLAQGTVAPASALASNGNGIYKEGGRLYAANSILAHNPSPEADNTCLDSEMFDGLVYSLVTDANCGAEAEDGNIQGDPQFVAPEQGDYHLASTSPAIDAGDPAAHDIEDIDGDVVPCGPTPTVDARSDMGFDEYAEGYVCYDVKQMSVFLPAMNQ